MGHAYEVGEGGGATNAPVPMPTVLRVVRELVAWGGFGSACAQPVVGPALAAAYESVGRSDDAALLVEPEGDGHDPTDMASESS
jgi:hypothetical protein